MQRLPNDTWLIYLLGGARLSGPDIRKLSIINGFVPATTAHLAVLRREVAAHRSELGDDWAMGGRVAGLVESSPDAVAAREMMMDPKVRPALELMFTAGASVGDLHEYVNTITSVRRSIEAVALYQHYFWDSQHMTDALWYELFKVHPRGALLRGCYQNGVDYALWKLGKVPSFRPEDVVRRVLSESTMRFMETTHMVPDESTARQGKFWAENIFKASDQLGKTGDGLKKIIDEVKSVSLRLGKRQISSLEDLRNGSDDSA